MLSVVICTHNPRTDYLVRTVQSLSQQTLPYSEWEFVLVDNASTQTVQTGIPGNSLSIRLVREEKVGLTQARLCGIDNTSGELIVFVDDDNVLTPDYLAHAANIAKTFPFLGVFGAGRIVAEFEQPPAAWAKPYLPMLALRHIEKDLWGNSLEENSYKPYGAGICLRREVAESFARSVKADPRRLRLGRQGQNLASCEDYDIASTTAAMGLGFGVFPRLKLTHLISAARVQPDYLLRLQGAMAESHAFLHYLWNGSKPGELNYRRGLRRRARSLLRGRTIEDRFWEAKIAGHKKALALIDQLEAITDRKA